MRILGLDIGERRIGVALSDPGAFLARPLETMPGAESAEGLYERLRPLFEEYEIGCVVVGLPLRMNADEGPEAVAVRELADALAELVAVPVVLWDERLTTVEATRMLIESGMRRSKRKRMVDQAAATLILQSYLDQRVESEGES